jgi:hypothetical protein
MKPALAESAECSRNCFTIFEYVCVSVLTPDLDG